MITLAHVVHFFSRSLLFVIFLLGAVVLGLPAQAQECRWTAEQLDAEIREKVPGAEKTVMTGDNAGRYLALLVRQIPPGALYVDNFHTLHIWVNPAAGAVAVVVVGADGKVCEGSGVIIPAPLHEAILRVVMSTA